MARKWEKLRNKLPAFTPERSWQEKIDEAKKKLVGEARNPEAANVALLGRKFATTKRRKAKLEHRIKGLNVELEALSQLLIAALEDQEMQKVELRGGVTLSISDRPYATMVDKKKLFAWIKANRAVYLLTVAHQSLNALVAERLAAGVAAPPGVKVFLKTEMRARGLRVNGQDEEDES